jgi:hypothetical protein
MSAYLRLFQNSSEAELTNLKVENEARRFVLLAIKVPRVIDFNDILQLNAVKFLQGVSFSKLTYHHQYFIL